MPVWETLPFTEFDILTFWWFALVSNFLGKRVWCSQGETGIAVPVWSWSTGGGREAQEVDKRHRVSVLLDILSHTSWFHFGLTAAALVNLQHAYIFLSQRLSPVPPESASLHAGEVMSLVAAIYPGVHGNILQLPCSWHGLGGFAKTLIWLEALLLTSVTHSLALTLTAISTFPVSFFSLLFSLLELPSK